MITKPNGTKPHVQLSPEFLAGWKACREQALRELRPKLEKDWTGSEALQLLQRLEPE